MGCGKSSIGKLLAGKLGVPFLDTDALISSETGKSIEQIFIEDGEPTFRALEKAALRKVCGLRNTVVALGGGTLMDSENASLASQSGIVIGLVASAREILCRTKDDKSRPLLTGCDNWEKLQRIEKLLKERLPSLGVSQLILDTSGLNLEQSCHAIIRFLSNLGYSGKTREQAGNNMETYTFEVRTPIGNEYSIIIADGLLGNCHKLVRDLFTRAGYSPKAAVVTNPLVEHLYAGTFCDALSKAGCQPVVITIPDGEDKKTPETALIIYEQLAAAGLNRNSPLFALGGGVVGDTAGFAASTFMRGIPLIQVPTTLLAQTDSSIGGKVAVNHHTAKNLIGSFYNPVMVLIDIQTLTTLPDREYIEGLAEVVKHGIILDKDFFTSRKIGKPF